MTDIAWFIRRLKAMSIPEVAWRVSQKIIQKHEQKKYGTAKISVAEKLFNQKLRGLHIDVSKMRLNYRNEKISLNTEIPLLGGYNYSIYKKDWSAGFQTNAHWPDEFSYFLKYKQRDDIGDARTNWELNRHFQFALLAKDYYATNDNKYLDEFIELFEDWNKKNSFLWGISWTSVMEVAIRCSNWCYSYCFLKKTKAPETLLNLLETGILNMTDYIANHYSSFSSANNHLIIEAYSIGQTGILVGYKPWIDLSINILTRELPLQNYSDGINKELSIHYQSFYMEAMGLMMRLMKYNNIIIPDTWKPMLIKMCEYVATCIGNYGEVIVFGDNDEGKILDLYGGLNHYQFVLELFSCLLPEKYVDSFTSENLRWLFDKDSLNKADRKKRYIPPLSICNKEGGNTILRSQDGRVLIGIDHAALGFGSIAAHGHADALSFQMFVDGKSIFVDPGTYIYHCDLKSRNSFRKTENHNTVCINGKDQSEMLGAFLWGRKASCELLEYSINGFGTLIYASHNGYGNKQVLRKFKYDGYKKFIIDDFLTGKGNAEGSFILSPEIGIEQISDNEVKLTILDEILYIKCSEKFGIKQVYYSSRYGVKEKTDALIYKINFNGTVTVRTIIMIK